MRRFALVVVLFASALFSQPGSRAQAPVLLRTPSLSDTQIAFRHADDIWVVSREGGTARRLSSTANVTEGPYFSPDGKTLAYSARVAGDVQVYTLAVTGGVPKRITYHPGGNYVMGWTPDGQELLFGSMQDAVACTSRSSG